MEVSASSPVNRRTAGQLGSAAAANYLTKELGLPRDFQLGSYTVAQLIHMAGSAAKKENHDASLILLNMKFNSEIVDELSDTVDTEFLKETKDLFAESFANDAEFMATVLSETSGSGNQQQGGGSKFWTSLRNLLKSIWTETPLAVDQLNTQASRALNAARNRYQGMSLSTVLSYLAQVTTIGSAGYMVFVGDMPLILQGFQYILMNLNEVMPGFTEIFVNTYSSSIQLFGVFGTATVFTGKVIGYIFAIWFTRILYKGSLSTMYTTAAGVVQLDSASILSFLINFYNTRCPAEKKLRPEQVQGILSNAVILKMLDDQLVNYQKERIKIRKLTAGLDQAEMNAVNALGNLQGQGGQQGGRKARKVRKVRKDQLKRKSRKVRKVRRTSKKVRRTSKAKKC